MDQKAFLVLNAIIIALVVMFFLRSRKKETPSRLNLSNRGRIPHGESYSPSERSINVIFQYNGHSWDAFEVLGIPAGSSKGDAEAAYDKLVRNADKNSKKFFKAALDAIRAS